MAEANKEEVEKIKALLDEAGYETKYTPNVEYNWQTSLPMREDREMEVPKYASREEAVKGMGVDTVMYINRRSDGFLTDANIKDIEREGNTYNDLKDSNIDALKDKALQMLQDPKILGLEARANAAKKEFHKFEKDMEAKYKDAPELTEKDMVYIGDGVNRQLNAAEKDDLDTRMFIGTKVVRVDRGETERRDKVNSEYFETSEVFHKAVREKVEELHPNGNNTERTFIGNAFYRSDDFLDKEKGKAAEVLKEGQNVPAPVIIDPATIKAQEAGKQ